MEVLTFFLREYMRDEFHKRKTRLLKQQAAEEIKDRLRTATEAGDEKAEAELLVKLGNVYAYYSDFMLSDTIYRQAAAIAHQIADKHLEAIVLANLGLSYNVRMDYASAYSYYQKAIKITREVGDHEFKQKILEHMDELNNMINIEKLSKE